MKVYVAAMWGMKEFAREYAVFLDNEGHEITSNWLNAEFAKTHEDSACEAQMDLNDVDRADALVLITLKIGTPFISGGRMVEFGYALKGQKKIIIVGDRENLFTHLPQVHQVHNIDKAAELLNQWQKEADLDPSRPLSPIE